MVVTDGSATETRLYGFLWGYGGDDCPMSRSVERAAANELAFRKANQDIDRARAELEFTGERTPYICERGDAPA
jgi:hypothetical protein